MALSTIIEGSVPKRLMREDEIPAFVSAIIETGCDICAVGHDSYILGDADLSLEAYEKALPEIEAIEERFGDRDFLILPIIAYLRSIGRYLDPETEVAH